MQTDPADETKLSIALNVVIPALIASAILLASVIADVNGATTAWTQRSGNVLIVVGAYIGYHEATKALQFIGSGIYFNPEIWYKFLAITLVLVGTIVSGYGDLIVGAMA